MINEMKVLRDHLDELGILWEDTSTLYDFMPEVNIYRTSFELAKIEWHVVGGEIINPNGNLEIISDGLNDGDPIPNLTAIQVLKEVGNVCIDALVENLQGMKETLNGVEENEEEICYEDLPDEYEYEEEIATPEQRKAEAIKRMNVLGIFDPVIEEFKSDGTIQYSEPSKIGGSDVGALYWLHNEPEWLKLVEEFEKQYNSTAYHVVHSYTSFGEMLSILYVSQYPEEWEMDNYDIKDGYVMTYTINLDAPDCSEFGTIVVQKASGGLVRVG